jgi:hypothetical protein
MPIRTPRVTLIVRREGKRVALPAGKPVELLPAEIEHLDRDSPDALMPVAKSSVRPEPAAGPVVLPAEVSEAGDGDGDAETEEERLAREAVERAKAGAAAKPGKTAGKPGKAASKPAAAGGADDL